MVTPRPRSVMTWIDRSIVHRESRAFKDIEKTIFTTLSMWAKIYGPGSDKCEQVHTHIDRGWWL